MMKVAAYTGGLFDPAARARVRQFIKPLDELGIGVTEYPLPYGCTQPGNRILLPAWAAATIAGRLVSLMAGRSADVSLVSRQLLPTYLPLQGLMKRPAVLDVDDAIWLNRGGQRVPELANSVQAVVCGNRFLADRFRIWNPNIYIIPTAVDPDFYPPGNAAASGSDGVVIGWTGTSGNFAYLYLVEDALKQILDRYENVRILVVADKPPEFRTLPQSRVEFIRWTPESEGRAVARMSIGLMPLEDSEWARGKCSYKMLCYMAACLPVVVSPVGMNNDVLAQGTIGFGASSTDEWVRALAALIEDQALRIELGQAGRQLIESHYSVKKLAVKYSEALQSLGQ